MEETGQIIRAAGELIKVPIQIIQIPIQGVMMGFQTIMGGAYGLQAVASFAMSVKQHQNFEKALGGTDLNTLMEVSGGDLQIMELPEEHVEGFLNLCSEYRIPYAALKQENQEQYEIFFPTNCVPRVNIIIKKMDLNPKIQMPEEYVANHKEMLDPSANTAKMSTQQQEMIRKLQIENYLEDETLQAFSLNIDSLVISQDEDSVMTRVPKSYGNLRVQFSKKRAFLIDQDQTILIFQDKTEPVQILNEKNEVVKTTTFASLHQKFYSSVDSLSHHRQYTAKEMYKGVI